MLDDKLTLSDKVAYAYSLGRQRFEDVVEMVHFASGWSDAELEASSKNICEYQSHFSAQT